MSESAIVEVKPHAEAVWAVVRPRVLDDVACSRMQSEVIEAADARSNAAVILDLTPVEYVPSLGLGALVSLHRQLRQKEHRLLLTGLHPDVRMTLAVTRLDKLFEIYPTFDDALNRIRETA
jgi:anti-anti-sigma factor